MLPCSPQPLPTCASGHPSALFLLLTILLHTNMSPNGVRNDGTTIEGRFGLVTQDSFLSSYPFQKALTAKLRQTIAYVHMKASNKRYVSATINRGRDESGISEIERELVVADKRGLHFKIANFKVKHGQGSKIELVYQQLWGSSRASKMIDRRTFADLSHYDSHTRHKG